MSKTLIALAIAFALTSCAKMEVLRVANNNDETKGVRFYRPWPYLLISPVLDKEGALLNTTIATIIWLPNLAEQYQILPDAGIGSVDISPTLTDGWNLTALNSKIDSKASENIGAIADLLSSIGEVKSPTAAVTDGGENVKKLPVGLYRLKLDTKTGFICGIETVIGDTPTADVISSTDKTCQ